MTPPVGTLPNRLRKVRLRNVSLVDRPAAQHATVVLFKSATPPVVDFSTAYDLIKARPRKKPRLGSGKRFSNLLRRLARKLDVPVEKKPVRDPQALAAWIGRRKFGMRRFQRLAARGRRRAA